MPPRCFGSIRHSIAPLDAASLHRPRTGVPMHDTTTHARVERQPCTLLLDPALVSRVRAEIGERDMTRSIEAALAAALDYQLWVREVAAGRPQDIKRK
jgi:hypothetical protein